MLGCILTFQVFVTPFLLFFLSCFQLNLGFHRIFFKRFITSNTLLALFSLLLLFYRRLNFAFLLGVLHINFLNFSHFRYLWFLELSLLLRLRVSFLLGVSNILVFLLFGNTLLKRLICYGLLILLLGYRRFLESSLNCLSFSFFVVLHSWISEFFLILTSNYY